MKYKFLYNIIPLFIVFLSFIDFSEDTTFRFDSLYLKTFLPQGFAFFTREPKEPNIFIYKIENEREVKRMINKSSLSADALLGLNRNNRRTEIEFQYPISKIYRWHKSIVESENYIDTIYFKIKEINTVKGKFLFVKERRIPWAWIKNNPRKIKEYKILILNP